MSIKKKYYTLPFRYPVFWTSQTESNCLVDNTRCDLYCTDAHTVHNSHITFSTYGHLFALVRAHQQGKDKSMEKRIERVALNFSSTRQCWDLLHLLSWKRWNGKRPCNIALLAKVMFLQIRCLQAADLMSVHVSVCRKLLGNKQQLLTDW